MAEKKLYGKDAMLFLAYKNTVFAEAEHFVAKLVEQLKFDNLGTLGKVSLLTGYKVKLRLDEVNILDQDVVQQMFNDLNEGLMPELSFKGKFRRNDNQAQQISFRNCILAGEINIRGLLQGFVSELYLAVNDLSDEQLQYFMTHGE